MAEVSEDCVNCAIGLLFNFSAYMGISKTIFNCNHANKQILGAKSVCFNLKHLFAIFSLLIITVSNYYYFTTKHTFETTMDNGLLFDMLLVNLDGFLYLIATITVMNMISQNERINNMLMFFDAVLKDFHAGTSRHLISKDDVIFFRTRVYVDLIAISVFYATGAVCMYCTNIEPIWNTIERFGLLLCIYSCLLMICIALVFLKLVFCANTKYKRFLRIDLENISNDSIVHLQEDPNCRIVALPRTNVKELFKVYTDTYIEFIKIFKTFNKVCNPIILVFVLFIVVACVISVDLIIICIEKNIHVSMRFFAAEFGMLSIIISTGFCIVRFGKMNTQVSTKIIITLIIR